MAVRHASWSTRGSAGHNWALVLAAGEGSRLQALTTMASGVVVPKQFCSLGNGSSLLHAALERARAVAPAERICAVVAKHHERWWETLPCTIPARNIVVQPRNRGTANGILLPLLQILNRDPDATLLVLPSDHYVHNESVLAQSLHQALVQSHQSKDRITLLGLTPDSADPELGYIVPANDRSMGSCDVREFVEKPSTAAADALIDERLPSIDFSKDIIERCASQLRVLKVPSCGWSDLGTPRRVAAAIKYTSSTLSPSPSVMPHVRGFLDLVTQHMQAPVQH